MVQIDGDDWLTPHGVWLYQHIASLKNPPDAICLKNQIALCAVGKMFSKDQKKGLKKFFTVPEASIEYVKMEKELSKKKTPEEVQEILTAHKDYYGQQAIFAEDDDAHCRVTFFSRKAAKYPFPEEFVVGEDTLQYYDLKDAHMKGKLVILCNDEAPATYIYDQLHGAGTVWKETKGFSDWSWMINFNKEIAKRKRENRLHEKDLPLLKIDYSKVKNPVFNDINTSGLVTYARGSAEVHLPANASEKCIVNALEERENSLRLEK